jgi:hypothetical protein
MISAKFKPSRPTDDNKKRYGEYIEILANFRYSYCCIDKLKDFNTHHQMVEIEQVITRMIIQEWEKCHTRIKKGNFLEARDDITFSVNIRIKKSAMFKADPKTFSLAVLGIKFSRLDREQHRQYVDDNLPDRIKGEMLTEDDNICIYTASKEKHEYLTPSGEIIPVKYNQNVKEPTLTSGNQFTDTKVSLPLQDAVDMGIVFPNEVGSAGKRMMKYLIKGVIKTLSLKDTIEGKHSIQVKRSNEFKVAADDYSRIVKNIQTALESESKMFQSIINYITNLEGKETELLKGLSERSKIREELFMSSLKYNNEMHVTERKLLFERMEADNRIHENEARLMFEKLKMWPHWFKFLEKIMPMIMKAIKEKLSPEDLMMGFAI